MKSSGNVFGLPQKTCETFNNIENMFANCITIGDLWTTRRRFSQRIRLINFEFESLCHSVYSCRCRWSSDFAPTTSKPTSTPTLATTSKPIAASTLTTTAKPTPKPIVWLARKQTAVLTKKPFKAPSVKPTKKPSSTPTAKPTKGMTSYPTNKPTKDLRYG